MFDIERIVLVSLAFCILSFFMMDLAKVVRRTGSRSVGTQCALGKETIVLLSSLG